MQRAALLPTGSAFAVAALVAVTGCAQDQPVLQAGAEVPGGNPAPDLRVTEDLTLTAVQLAFPEDGVWEEGEDVPLYGAIANTGPAGDRLVDVSGPDFAAARVVGPDGAQGAVAVAPDDTVYLEPPGPPSVTLLGLERSLRSSQSVSITFTFEEAGEVSVETPVSAEPFAGSRFTDPAEDPTG